ncbi:Integrator complex subunit 3 [Linnemannia gamsii]|uniref:Integrator complex subunit 3 n=1 Tax=Linnemannia gamsii TaxID=64522 RepID=A0ABQ7JTU4_9FUNG|nr:Integrator complex subunit 3 [Linnemannia gamsii]
MATLEQQHAPSYILDLRLYDDEDSTDVDLAKDYNTLVAIFPGKSEMEIQHHLQEIVSADMVKHAEILNGLLYAILTYHSHPGSPAFGSNEPSNGVNGNAAAPNPNRQHSYSCQNLARLMRLVQRDSYGHVFKQTRYFCQYPSFQKIRPAVREQLIWVVGYITESRMPAIHSIEQLHTALLKQVRGGDVSIPNVQHAESTLRLLQGNQDFVDASTIVIAYSCYTYMRVILDHGSSRLAVLRQQEVNYCVRLLREKFRECSELGRDLVRALQDVGRGIPEFEAIWVDLLYNPRSLNPQLENIRQILAVPSPKIYLASRLSYDMEQKLLHILEHIHNGQHFRNVQWFTERFLPTPESDTLYPDIMRYICGVYHPANAVLAGPTSPVTASNVKLALMYDWLFFEPARDSIMNIEPAMLLMERSIERAPYITAVMMEFLFFAIENYYPPLREYIQEHVAKAAQSIADKGVIRAPQLNDFPSIREYMLSMFRPHVADANDQNQGLPSSSSLTTDNSDDPLALGGDVEGGNGSGDLDGSQDEPQTGLEWEDDSGDEGSLPHKEAKKSDPTTLSHRSRESSKEPMQLDEPGSSSSNISSSTLSHGGEDDQEEDEVMESSADVGSSSKSSNVPPQVQSRTLMDWTMTDEDGADASEPGTGDNSNNASTTGSPDPEASLWIFGGLIHSFKSAYEADSDSQETMLMFQQVCEVYEAGVGVESANMAQMFGQEICMFARKCRIPESYAAVRNRSKPFLNERSAQNQDESMEEDVGGMGALMACLWRITEKEGRQGAERVAQMLSNCEASVDPSSRLLSMWYLIGLVHGYRSRASSGAPITLEDSLSLYGSYLQNAAERDLAQTPAEDGAEMDQEERVKSAVQEYLVRDLQKLQDQQPTVFDAVLPLVLQYLSDYIPRTESFLRMVIFLATPTQIYCLSLGLSQRQFALFSSLSSEDGALAKAKKVKKMNDMQEDRGSPNSTHSSLASGWEPRVGEETLEVIGQTLEWGTFDQMGIWQLIVSEFGGVLKAITGLLSANWVPSMTSDAQAEALGGLLNLIRTLSLSPPDIRLGTTIVRIASRTDIVSYDMVQFCQRWIGQSASMYPDHLGAILLSLSDKTAAPIWEELNDLGLGSPSSSVPTTPTPKATRSRIGSGSQSKRPKLTVKQRKEQGALLRTALSLIRGWCETLSVEVTQQHFLRVWSAQVRSQVLESLTENFGVNEKQAWPKDWWIKDDDSVSQNDEDMEIRHSDEDDDEDNDNKEEDSDEEEEGGRGNTNNSSRKNMMSEDEEEDSDQDRQSSDSERRKKDKKRFGGAASGSESSSRRNSPKMGSASSSTMGSNVSTPTASKKGSSAGVLNSKSRSTRATSASTKKATPTRKAAASRRRKISEDDEEEEEEEEDEAQDDDDEEEEEEEEEEEAQDEEMDEDEKSKNGEEESNDEDSEEETKGKKGKGKRSAKKAAAPATPAKRAATTRSQVKKPAAKPLTRSNRRTRKQEEEEDEGDEEDDDEDEDGGKKKDDEEEESDDDDDEGGEGEDDDEDEEEEEEEEESLTKGKLPVYTQRRAAANANSKLLASKAASAAATSSASKAKAAPKSRAKNKRRIVTDDESD